MSDCSLCPFLTACTAITLIALCFPANGVLQLQSTSFPPSTRLPTPCSKLFSFLFLTFFSFFFFHPHFYYYFLVDVEFWQRDQHGCYLYPGIIQHPKSHLHFVIMTAFNMTFLFSLETWCGFFWLRSGSLPLCGVFTSAQRAEQESCSQQCQYNPIKINRVPEKQQGLWVISRIPKTQEINFSENVLANLVPDSIWHLRTPVRTLGNIRTRFLCMPFPIRIANEN